MKRKENFTPCAMPCTQEQWQNQLKPLLELIDGVEIVNIDNFNIYPYIVNKRGEQPLNFTNYSIYYCKSYNYTILPEFDLCKFLQLSGLDVVIQGSIEKREKIKQWWGDRMGGTSWMGFDSNYLFYGIIGGNFKCLYKEELPEGTHIINPFKIVAYAPDTVVGHFYSKNDGENNAVGYLVEPGKDLGAHGKHSIGITEPNKAVCKNTFIPNYNSPKTFPRWMYASDEPISTNNIPYKEFAVGELNGRIVFMSSEKEYNRLVENGDSYGIYTFKYTHEIDEPLPKAQYTIEQLIEKAGLNKDDIEIV